MYDDFKSIKIERDSTDENRVYFTVSLSQCFGVSAANLIRRVLLSNISSTRIIGVKIISNDKIAQKFVAIDGILDFPIEICNKLSLLSFEPIKAKEDIEGKLFELNFHYDNTKGINEINLIGDSFNNDEFKVISSKDIKIMDISVGAKVDITLYIRKDNRFCSEEENEKILSDFENVMVFESNHSDSRLITPSIEENPSLKNDEDGLLSASIESSKRSNLESHEEENIIRIGVKTIPEFSPLEMLKSACFRISKFYTDLAEKLENSKLEG